MFVPHSSYWKVVPTMATPSSREDRQFNPSKAFRLVATCWAGTLLFGLLYLILPVFVAEPPKDDKFKHIAAVVHEVNLVLLIALVIVSVIVTVVTLLVNAAARMEQQDGRHDRS